MAEEKKPSEDFGPLEIGLGIIILFFVFTFIFQNIHAKLGSAAPGSVLYDIQKIFSGFKSTITSDSAGAPLAIGSAIRNAHASILFDSPGGDVLQGVAEGALGIISGGPEEFGGSTWWRVFYDDGSEGWVTEGTVSPRGGEAEDLSEETGPIFVVYSTFQVVSTAVSLLLLVGIAYSVIRLFQIRQEGSKIFESNSFFGEEEEGPQMPGVLPSEKPGKVKWGVIQKHINSDSESDWRLAILEADILLDEIVRSQGWPGENLGERLKAVDRGDFRTIDKAWEAHKLRNTLAHEGVNFALSQREARRIAGLYEEVFREFDYI